MGLVLVSFFFVLSFCFHLPPCCLRVRDAATGKKEERKQKTHNDGRELTCLHCSILPLGGCASFLMIISLFFFFLSSYELWS